MEKVLGKKGDYNYIHEKVEYYKKFIDRSHLVWMKSKAPVVSWVEPLDGFNVMTRNGSRQTAFQSTWFVPMMWEGLIQLIGWPTKFHSKLNRSFEISSN